MQSLQHRRDALLGFFQQVLQVQQDLLALVLVDEGGGNPRLALAACTAREATGRQR
jgi:hypothetical protein